MSEPFDSDDSLPLSVEMRIDAICKRFEAAWREGSDPDLAAFLQEVGEAERFALFKELLRLDLHYREARGERPSPQDYISRFPFSEPIIIALFASRLIEGLKSRISITPQQLPPVVESTRDYPFEESSCPFLPGSHLRPPVLQKGSEPIPGYQIISPLGSGGFGEVWKASGPGGFEVAFKFVPLSGRASAVEQQALDVMRQVRHPGLINIFGTWQTPDRLVIGMELADRTLRHRFEQAVAQGGAGIPRKELLGYMMEVAKVLDFLNQPRHFLGESKQPVGIQHGDIKPQNIFLVGEGVKLGDFGLVSLLEKRLTTRAEGMTLAYAAPEVIDGQVSRWSDQYALAATYCQMRGGTLPFHGASRSTVPDLRGIPQEEREAVLRALVVTPHARWPNCRTFVKQLMNSGRAGEGGGVFRAGQKVGTSASGYQLLHLTGHGKFGSVWQAVNSTGTRVAVRIARLPPDLPISPLLSALEKLRLHTHPYTLRVHNSWVEDDHLVVVTEWCEDSLQKRWREQIQQGKPIPADELLPCFREIAIALDDLHVIRLHHGRLRPSNFLLKDGHVKLADCHGEWLYQERGIKPDDAGPLSRAPEVHSMGQSKYSDQYSLALLYAELRTGRPMAHPGESDSPLRPDDLPEGLSRAEKIVLSKALASHPLKRYPTCRAFVSDLQAAHSGKPLPAVDPPADSQISDGRGNRGMKWTPWVLYLAVLLACFAVQLAGPRIGDGVKQSALILGLALVAAGFVTLLGTRRRSKPASPEKETATPEAAHDHAREVAPQETIQQLRATVTTFHSPEAPFFEPEWQDAIPAESGRHDQGLLPRSTFEEHIDSVWGVAFSPGGKLLASGSMDRTIQLWSLSTGQRIHLLEGHAEGVSSVAFLDNARLISGGLDGTVRLWDVASGEELLRLHNHAGRVFAVASDGARHIASGGEDRTVRVWDLELSREVACLRGHGGWVRGVAFSTPGHFVSASEDGTVRQWDIATGKEIKRLTGHSGSVTSVALTRGGAFLVSGGEDGSVRVWDVASGRTVHRLDGHADWVRAVAISEDGNLLLSGSDDETILLWDLNRGQEICRYQGHAWAVLGVAFSPTGQIFASGSDDCTVRLWVLPS